MELHTEFSQQLALSLYKSTEKYPVNLDKAWMWIGYKQKRNAVNTLKSMFEEDLDYLRSNTQSISGGRSSVCYMLTVNCFKELGMVSKTQKGKQIRQYFMECETIAKKITETVNPALLDCLNNMQQEMKTLSARTQKLDNMEKATNNNKGIKNVLDTEMEDIYPDDVSFTVREYLDYKGVDLRHIHTLRKRAIQFYRNGTQDVALPKKSTEVLFKGANVGYLDSALKTVLGLD